MRVPVPDSRWLLQLTPTAPPTQEPLTYSQPVDTLPIVDDARWSAWFTDSSFPALLVWIGMLLLIQFAALPITRRLFRRFPDQGWGFSRIVSLLLAAMIVWFPASIGLSTFRVVWCWLAIALLAAASWIWQKWRPQPDSGAERSARPVIVATEAVFWLVFAFFLVLRLFNPDSYEPIWGGEKAMEFAHINSILRSAEFPPVDPWYAGGYLNYYYYGSYLMAFLMKLTGIPSEIAFNLALPTVMALLATGVFSIGLALGRSFSSSRTIQYAAGAAATVFTVFIGNLVAAARTWESITTSELRYSFDYWVWGPTRIFSDAATGKYGITEFPYFSALYGDLHAHLIAMPITVLVVGLILSIWLDHRSVDVDLESSTPPLVDTVRPLLMPCGLLGVAMGSLFMTNAWDAPTFGIVCVVGILAAFTGTRPLLGRLLVSGIAIFVIALVAYIVTYPFNQHYVALYSSIGEVREKTSLLPVEAHWGIFIVILTAGFATLGLGNGDRQCHKLLDPLVVLPFLGLVLCLRWYAANRSASLQDAADILTVLTIAAIWLGVTWFGIRGGNDFGLPDAVLRVLTIIAAIVALDGLIIGRPVLALYAVMGICAGIAWLARTRQAERFVYGLIACGMLLGATLELVYLADDLLNTEAYRMNSVFKFYNQIWILLAIASAGCVAKMLAVAMEKRDVTQMSPEEQPDARPTVALPQRWAQAGLVLTAFVTLLGFAYPVQATVPRLETRFPHPDSNITLDAYAWMTYAEMPFLNAPPVTYADDLAAIDWFNDEVAGHPVIAEAAFGTYRCNGSRFSIATGLPAVIGWERHQQQQRDRNLLPQRVQDMRQLYSSSDPDIKRQLIDRYDISYIVVGQTERNYPVIQGNECQATDVSAGISAIEAMVGSDLEIAFSQGTTTVYRVTHPRS